MAGTTNGVEIRAQMRVWPNEGGPKVGVPEMEWVCMYVDSQLVEQRAVHTQINT